MTSKSTYDQIYHQSSDYNPKAHRDDRQHSNFVGLFQIQENKDNFRKQRSSNAYGYRHDQQIDFIENQFVKIEHIRNEFYRSNGVFN